MRPSKEIKLQFRSSIRRGTGEAYLIIDENPEIDFSRDIIKASIYNWAYDGQCESSRATYLFDIIKKSQNQDKIRVAIIDALLKEKDTWDLTQLFDLARLYAREGNTQAYDAIYKRFIYESNLSSWVGAYIIIELDGLKGLLFVVDKIGEYIKNQVNVYEDDFIIRYFIDLYPTIDIDTELKKTAIQNSNIQIYLDCISMTEQHQMSMRSTRPVYANILDEIEQKPYFRLGNRKLTDQEIIQIADKFLSEIDLKIKAKFLNVFTYLQYPYGSTILLVFARGKSNKHRVKEYAIEALKHIKSVEVRQLFLDKIHNTTTPAVYTDLLLTNYKNGDFLILSNIANKFTNEHIIESLAFSYVDIYTKNKTPECQIPLEILYRKMNCGIHRNSIVEILIENNVLSETLKKEIQYDCDDDTRKLYFDALQ